MLTNMAAVGTWRFYPLRLPYLGSIPR